MNKPYIDLTQPLSVILQEMLSWWKREIYKDPATFGYNANFPNDKTAAEWMGFGFSLRKMLSDLQPASNDDLRVKRQALIEIIEHKFVNPNGTFDISKMDPEDLMIYTIAKQLASIQSITPEPGSIITINKKAS